MDDLVVVALDDANAVGVWRNVVLELVRGQQTTAAVDLAHEKLSALLKAYPEKKVALLVICEPGSKAPAPDVRARIEASHREVGPRVAGTCMVIEGDGFQASVLRSALAAFSLIGLGGVMGKVTASTDDAVSWVAKAARMDVSEATALRRAVAEFRARCSPPRR